MMLLKFQSFWIIMLQLTSATSISESESEEDILVPYKGHHGPVFRRLRDTQQCQHVRYGNTTYSLHTAHVNESDFNHVVDFHYKIAQVGQYFYAKRYNLLRFQRVYNPMRTFSILEPGHRGSCEEKKGVRVKVHDTAVKNKCVFAANAGFFDIHSGHCLGNIVSDGRLVQDTGGIQNVHFGITKSGQLFTGYLSEIELVTLQFKQLVGGVLWLIRDGEVYLDESKTIECPDTETTGTIDRFIEVKSARSAVGHDAEGRIMMVQVDGETNQRGVDLHEFADILKDFGFVNAINLDGGGSVTSVVNGVLINYPYDHCINSTWNCERAVSTILCVHSAECVPHPNCSDHGQCVSGHCQCHPPWSGKACDTLACPDDCSGHGQCLEGGCLCEAGWKGENCSVQCEQGRYGVNCSGVCYCVNGATCDPVSGWCNCTMGYTGMLCENECDCGWYGEKCQKRCDCPHPNFCHHISGACFNTSLKTEEQKSNRCILTRGIEVVKLVPVETDQNILWQGIAVVCSVIALISIGINVWLALSLCNRHQYSRCDS